MDVYSLMS